MKVILLTDVPKVGRKYEIKEIPDGYAANYLLPQNKAERATPKKIKKFESQREMAENEQKVREELLKRNLKSLKGVVVTLSVKANDQGHLYEGLHAEEVCRALQEQTGIEIPKEMLTLAHPLKKTGEHKIPVSWGKKKGEFALVVEGLQT